MSLVERMRTRGLVVAALLSVASFTGTEKELSKSEGMVENVNSVSHEWHASKGDKSKNVNFNEEDVRVAHNALNQPVSGGISKRGKKSRREKAIQTPRRTVLGGNKLWKVSIGHKSRHSSRKGKVLGKKMRIRDIPLEEQENLEPLVLSAQTFEELEGPKIERKVSWGENTYHLTHSGEDYDRTSWPDPYDNDGYEEECTTDWWSSKYRPLGMSIILIYVSLFLLTVVPETTSIL